MSRRELNVSELPSIVFSYRSLMWWGTAGLMMIEGTMFAITVASYFFLRTRSADWPPGLLAPRMTAGTMNLAVMIASVLPNIWIQKAAERGRLRTTRILIVVMTLVGVANLAIRWFEFPSLLCTWDQNAYASVTWTLLGLHTVHLITDWFDTAVLAVLMFTPHVEGRRFMDVSENADYWYFVVLTWIPIWAVIYLAPRFL